MTAAEGVDGRDFARVGDFWISTPTTVCTDRVATRCYFFFAVPFFFDTLQYLFYRYISFVVMPFFILLFLRISSFCRTVYFPCRHIFCGYAYNNGIIVYLFSCYAAVSLACFTI